MVWFAPAQHMPFHLSHCSGRALSNSGIQGSVQRPTLSLALGRQQHSTSRLDHPHNVLCFMAFRLLVQEVSSQEVLYTKLKDLVQDLQKAALVSQRCPGNQCTCTQQSYIHAP